MGGVGRWAVVIGLIPLLGAVVAGGLSPDGRGSWTDPAAASTPELPLVVAADVVRTYSSDPSGRRLDPWVVWVCRVEVGGEPGEPTERLPITPADVVAELDAHIAPYFDWLSGGAYRPTFAAGGSIDSGSADPQQAVATCQDHAAASPASVGFAGAVVITDAPIETGHGTSGQGDCPTTGCPGPRTYPDNGRSLELGAHDLFPTETYHEPWLAETAHELGHTLDWGHAGPAAEYRVYQPYTPGYQPIAGDAPWLDDIVPSLLDAFDAFLESMSLPTIEADRAALGSASVDCATTVGATVPPPGTSLCLLLSQLEYGDLYDLMGSDPSYLTPDTRALPPTQVFNRYAAGWLVDDEIEVHPGGDATYVIAPIGVNGTQMLVFPSPDPHRFVTIEARGTNPFFPGDDGHGVQLHLVDQGPYAGSGPAIWGDRSWKTTAYVGSPWNRDGIVLRPGDTVVVDGQAVEVVSVDPDGTYTIRVGTPPDDPVTPSDPSDSPSRAAVTAQPTFTG